MQIIKDFFLEENSNDNKRASFALTFNVRVFILILGVFFSNFMRYICMNTNRKY